MSNLLESKNTSSLKERAEREQHNIKQCPKDWGLKSCVLKHSLRAFEKGKVLSFDCGKQSSSN